MAAVGIVALAVIVPLAVYRSMAATGAVALEPESGNVLSPATVSADSSAAGNSYVQFAPAGSGGGASGQCGLTGQVFCEDFEEGRVNPAGQSGDWSPTLISTSRYGGNTESVSDPGPNQVLQGEIPACRTGSVSNPLPPADTLICDPNSNIKTHYGLSTTAVGNYSDNSYRIAQPFDIAGRTGTISFDADLDVVSGLWGWPQLVFTSDPIAIPGYYRDNSRGSAPGNGIQYQFPFTCANAPHTTNVLIRTYNNYRDTDVTNQADFDACTANPTTSKGHLNRVIIKLSQTHTDIYISNYSADGINFSTPKLVMSKNINLTFTRGYISFTGHNHATRKYSDPKNGGPGLLRSWTVLWDNIAFDGPSITPDRVYQVPDRNAVQSDGTEYLSWYLPYPGDTPMTPLSVPGVNKTGTASAKLSFHIWFNSEINANYNQTQVKYRINGGTWHSTNFSEGQLWALNMPEGNNPPGVCCNLNMGSNNFVIDVDPAEIITGTNTLEFQGTNMNGGYHAIIDDIDLLLR